MPKRTRELIVEDVLRVPLPRAPAPGLALSVLHVFVSPNAFPVPLWAETITYGSRRADSNVATGSITRTTYVIFRAHQSSSSASTPRTVCARNSRAVLDAR